MADETEDESTEARFRKVQEELKAMKLPEMPDDEVDARLDALKSPSHVDLPTVPNVEAQLRGMEQRAAQARNLHAIAKGGERSRFENDGRSTKGLGVGLAIAYALIGLPLVGLGLGYLLQKLIGGPWIAIGVVVGFVGGIAFAVYVNGRETDRL